VTPIFRCRLEPLPMSRAAQATERGGDCRSLHRRIRRVYRPRGRGGWTAAHAPRAHARRRAAAAVAACEWYSVGSFRNWVIHVTLPWPYTELLSKVGNVHVRIGSGRSQARQMAEVGSGSEKYPHSTLCHSPEQMYPVTHFGKKVPEKRRLLVIG